MEKRAKDALRMIDYVDFCIRYQLKEIMEHVAENNTLDRVRNELVDVINIAHTGIAALGESPKDAIERRLSTRYEDKIPEIMRKYQKLFTEYLRELYGNS